LPRQPSSHPATGSLAAQDSSAGHGRGARKWFVVPGSGTGALATLRGDGGFTAQIGQHGNVWLDDVIE